MKIVLLFVFLLCISSFAKEAPKTKIKIAAIDWCPQICPTDKLNPGFLVEMIKDIFSSGPYELEFEYLPWSRAIYNVERGYADALLSPSKDEAPGLIYHKENLSFQTHCFWKSKDSLWNFSGVDSLGSIKFVVYRDHPYGTLLNDYFNKYKTDHYFEFSFDENYIDRAITFLQKDRAQSFLDTANSVAYHLKKKGIRSIVRDACIKQDELWLGLSPKNGKRTDDLRAYIDAHLHDFKNSERYQFLMKKYQISFPPLMKF